MFTQLTQTKCLTLISLTLLSVTLLFNGGSHLVYAQDIGDVEEVVTDFLSGWNNQDYPAMYGFLAQQSQQLYPQQVFQTRYQTNMEIIAFSGVTFTINEVRIQGMTAVVHYDATIQSASFGEIIDPNRIMRLANNNGRWGIAWSTMDIFAGLAGNARLTTSSGSQRRATIYDRNGDPIATDGQIVGLYGAQANMPNVDDCMVLLGEVLGVSTARLEQQFLPYSAVPTSVFFLGWLDENAYALHINRLRAQCGLFEDFTAFANVRMYYGGSAMGHVTGYIGPIPAERESEFLALGYGSGDLVGLLGIEREYETTLAGQPERILRIQEPGGEILRTFASTEGSPPTPIQLTIDRRLQLIVSQAINDAYNYAASNWAGLSIGAGAVVLDVNTGEILAMSSYPTYDPVIFQPAADGAIEDRFTYIERAALGLSEPLANRLLSRNYFPGSVYKIVTATAALNTGLVTPDTIFDCTLEWRGLELGDTQASRTDWRATDGLEATGEINPAEAITSSCNPFFWEMGGLLFRDVSPTALVEYSELYGMGRQYRVNQEMSTGVDGVLGNPTSADQVINSAIGQAPVSVPPIQLGVMAMTVANGGMVYNPYVVQQVGGFDDSPVTYVGEPEVISTVNYNPGVLEAIRTGMCGVTANTEIGTARFVFGDQSYSVCGKTGTAEAGPIAPNAWFVAYAPADDPQIAVMVMVDQSREGSEVAAPIVRRILDQYFNTFIEPYPDWWSGEYTPLNIPEGFVSDSGDDG